MFLSLAVLEPGSSTRYNHSGCAWLGQTPADPCPAPGQTLLVPIQGREWDAASPEALSGTRDSLLGTVAPHRPLVLLSTAVIVLSAAFISLVAEP